MWDRGCASPGWNPQARSASSIAIVPLFTHRQRTSCRGSRRPPPRTDRTTGRRSGSGTRARFRGNPGRSRGRCRGAVASRGDRTLGPYDLFIGQINVTSRMYAAMEATYGERTVSASGIPSAPSYQRKGEKRPPSGGFIHCIPDTLAHSSSELDSKSPLKMICPSRPSRSRALACNVASFSFLESLRDITFTRLFG